jgi:RNA 2',3'-cyclic 3'-phosphodiesterase
MRAFIAIDVPDDIQEQLGRIQAAFREGLAARPGEAAEIRWANRGGIHLTLKFLSEVPAEHLDGTIGALRECVVFEKFVLEVKGFGFFPDVRHPQTFWAGISAPPALADLQRRVNAAMALLGYPPETRRFTPHLTLARFKTPRPQPTLKALSAERQEQPLGTFEVTQFWLCESRLASGRPAEHLNLACFPEGVSLRGTLPSQG